MAQIAAAGRPANGGRIAEHSAGLCRYLPPPPPARNTPASRFLPFFAAVLTSSNYSDKVGQGADKNGTMHGQIGVRRDFWVGLSHEVICHQLIRLIASTRRADRIVD